MHTGISNCTQVMRDLRGPPNHLWARASEIARMPAWPKRLVECLALLSKCKMQATQNKWQIKYGGTYPQWTGVRGGQRTATSGTRAAVDAQLRQLRVDGLGEALGSPLQDGHRVLEALAGLQEAQHGPRRAPFRVRAVAQALHPSSGHGVRQRAVQEDEASRRDTRPHVGHEVVEAGAHRAAAASASGEGEIEEAVQPDEVEDALAVVLV
mmetsp:Transcript_174376/g.558998  ORF Transcript_174376/g.558998 Transcript_174376/m.558998 type:complete len:210 (+) Transcript_174376:2-631(+)